MIASLTFALTLLSPASLATQDCTLDSATDTRIDERSLARFHAAGEEYADLHRRLERALMIDHQSSWGEEGDMESETLADAIRAARPLARAGDIFRPEIGELFRFRIGRALWLHRYHTADALAELPPAVLEVPPRVHDWWAGEKDSVLWPTVLWELPVLPDELEYRVLGRHLVLVDPHANLVIDVLENALPEF